MVAPRRTKKIICTIVRVPVADDKAMHRTSTPSRFSTRPSDLLPWADPYISHLVTKLQSEVRLERQRQQNSRTTHSAATMDLDPPTPCTNPNTDVEWEGADEPRWTYRDEPTTDFRG